MAFFNIWQEKLQDLVQEKKHGELKISNVAIIGAGPAGLVAAYELLKCAGLEKIDIFEAGDRVGGRVLTVGK